MISKNLIIQNLIMLLLPLNLFCQDHYLGPDTSYCTNIPITLESNILDSTYTYTYLWNTGDTTSSIEIDKTGNYWLQIRFDSTWSITVDTG